MRRRSSIGGVRLPVHPRGGVAHAFGQRAQAGVLVRHALRGGVIGHRARPPAAQHAQRVQDHRDVDRFLQQRAGHRRQPAERGGQHGKAGQAHPRDDRLQRDPTRAPGDADRLGHPVQPIDRQHHLRRLGGRRRAARAHRHADIRRRQRRRVVDPVADHQRDALRPLRCHRGDLPGGRELRPHRVQAEPAAHRLRRAGAIAAQHHEARDPGGPQRPQRPRRLRAHRVGQQQRPGDPPIQRDPGRGGGGRGQPRRRALDRRRQSGGLQQPDAADQHPRVPDDARDPAAGNLLHLARQVELQVEPGAPPPRSPPPPRAGTSGRARRPAAASHPDRTRPAPPPPPRAGCRWSACRSCRTGPRARGPSVPARRRP